MKKNLLSLMLILVLATACNLPKQRQPTVIPSATHPAATRTPRVTVTPTLEEITVTATAEVQPGYTITSTRTYDLAFEVRLFNNGSGSADRISLVVAMVSDRPPFQAVLSSQVSHPYTLETDEFDNQYARVVLTDFPSGAADTVRFEYRVEVNALRYDLGTCSGGMAQTDIYPETYIESDAAEILQRSQDLSLGKATPCEQLRAFYEFIGDNMTYNGYNPGEVGALQALNNLEGDCTEFSDLLTALSRAAGIPARPVEGVTCCTTAEQYSAGNIKHNWVLANLPGVDWVPVDPTWGRFEGQRDSFFAATDDQHIILTVGRNPAPLNSYHGFTYNWWGDNVDITNEESWSVLEVTP
jgi:transglutaminase-like putative cysteine protease